MGVLSLFSCPSLSGHVVPSEASTGFSFGYGRCAVVEARASLWPVPDVVLWETISSLVAAPSLGSLDLFQWSFWCFVGSGCVSRSVRVSSAVLPGPALVVSPGLAVLGSSSAAFS